METYLRVWQLYPHFFNINLFSPNINLPTFAEFKKLGKALLGLALIALLNANITYGKLGTKYTLVDNAQIKGAATIAPDKEEEKLKIQLPTSKKGELKINDVFNPQTSWESLVSQAQITQAEAEAQIQAQNLVKSQERKNILSQAGLKNEFADLYESVSASTGVDWRILAAVHSVETGQSGDTSKASYAGAQGPMQFIPSTFKAYALDGNGDGVSNIHNVYDAMLTAGNYLRANGAASGNVQNALFRYNHSQAYINKVLGIAKNLGFQG